MVANCNELLQTTSGCVDNSCGRDFESLYMYVERPGKKEGTIEFLLRGLPCIGRPQELRANYWLGKSEAVINCSDLG